MWIRNAMMNFTFSEKKICHRENIRIIRHFFRASNSKYKQKQIIKPNKWYICSDGFLTHFLNWKFQSFRNFGVWTPSQWYNGFPVYYWIFGVLIIYRTSEVSINKHTLSWKSIFADFSNKIWTISLLPFRAALYNGEYPPYYLNGLFCEW